MPEDLKKLFQITEAARACSLSRSTLLRLEEKGLLTPAYTAPEETAVPMAAPTPEPTALAPRI